MKEVKHSTKVNLPEEMRLQRFIAKTGLASRRQAEEMIAEGRVKVNGKLVTQTGTKVRPRFDSVSLDGRRIYIKTQLKVLLLNKPKGVICTRKDPQGRETVYDMLGSKAAGLQTVGRLDYNSEGVLLLTNDGDLAYALTRPESRVSRVYRVRVFGPVDEDAMEDVVRNGVEENGELLRAESIEIDQVTSSNLWMTVVLREGKNRHIRRIMEALGLTVSRLIRVDFAGVTTENLRPGVSRLLEASEIATLRKAVAKKGKKKRPTKRGHSRKKG